MVRLVALEEKVMKTMAKKYGYLPGNVKQLTSFVKVIHNFASYLGSNKYYSDVLNKRIALLALDSDILALRAERSRLKADGFYLKIEIALLTKSKAELDKKEVEQFKKEMEALMGEAMKVNQRAIDLMEDVKKEYGGL